MASLCLALMVLVLSSAQCWKLVAGQAVGDALPLLDEQGNPTLAPWVQPLPRPSRVPVISKLTMVNCKLEHKFHPGLASTPVYGYGVGDCSAATSPGPTLTSIQGIASTITWVNNITDPVHLLPIDPRLIKNYPASNPYPTHGVPIAVHVHGGEQSPQSDGGPDTWYTAAGETGLYYHGNTSHYLHTQRPTTLVYHDHAHGVTRLNVYAGLFGFYLILDPKARTMATPVNATTPGLPPVDSAFDFEIAFQDKAFQKDGQLFYSAGVRGLDDGNYWIPEYFGPFIVVNGAVWPVMDVYPKLYRFRLTNSANARFFHLHIDKPGTNCTNGTAAADGCDVIPITQIGSDGGLYDSAVTHDDGLLMSPVDRVEIILDFSRTSCGDEFVVTNDAPAPYPGGGDNATAIRGEIGPGVLWKFVVSKGACASNSSNDTAAPLPLDLPLPKPLDARYPFMTLTGLLPSYRLPGCGAGQSASPWGACSRQVIVSELLDADENSLGGLLNGMHYASGLWMSGSITETPREGTLELWEIINLTEDFHPIHIHLADGQLIHRQDLAVDGNQTCVFAGKNGADDITSDLIYNPEALDACLVPGNITGPEQEEMGWKDVIRCPPGQVTRFAVRWAPQLTPVGGESTYPFDVTAEPGYIWHCHIVEHEDNMMMRPMQFVSATASNGSSTVGNTTARPGITLPASLPTARPGAVAQSDGRRPSQASVAGALTAAVLVLLVGQFGGHHFAKV